jgi:RimJ/RimL family protein N-acetyltransferase
VFRGPWVDTTLEHPTLTTARLTLRPHRVDDAEDWFAIQSVSAINRALNWPERTARESLQHLRDRTKHVRLLQADDFLALAMELDGRLIGDVSLRLKSVPAPTRSVEVAWLVHPDYSGHGYATEAAAAVLDLAFDALGARWATALIGADNTRSIAVAERLGLQGLPVDEGTIAFFGSPAQRRSSVSGERRGGR